MVKQQSIKEAEEVVKEPEVLRTPDAVQQSVRMVEAPIVLAEDVPIDSKYEELKEEPQKMMKAKKDPLPGFTGYNLPPLSMKKGAFDNDILR